LSWAGGPWMEPDMARLNTEDDIIDLRQLWLALLRRSWIVAAACVLSVLPAYVIARMATQVYEARTTLLIKDPGASGERMFLDTGAAVVTRNQVQNSVQILRGRLEEVRIAEAMRTSNVAVIDPAVPPTRPVSPRPMLNMALALFLGLFAGVAGALLLEFFDTTVKTPEEIGPLLGLPVLGRIPEERAGTDRS